MADDREVEETLAADAQEDDISDWSSEDESPSSPLEPSHSSEAVEQGWMPLANLGAEQAEDAPPQNGGHHIGIAELSNMTVEELGRRLAAGDTLAVTGEQLLNYQPDGATRNDTREGELSLEEEEQEEKRIAEQEAAIAEANAKEEERRRGPLPESNKEAIVSAMKGFTLNGYKPSWASGVPDEELVARVKRRSSHDATGS